MWKRFKHESLIHYLARVCLAGMMSMFRLWPLMQNGKKVCTLIRKGYTPSNISCVYLCVCTCNLSKRNLCSMHMYCACVRVFYVLVDVPLLCKCGSRSCSSILSQCFLHCHVVVTKLHTTRSPCCPPVGKAVISYFNSSWWAYHHPLRKQVCSVTTCTSCWLNQRYGKGGIWVLYVWEAVRTSLYMCVFMITREFSVCVWYGTSGWRSSRGLALQAWCLLLIMRCCWS